MTLNKQDYWDKYYKSRQCVAFPSNFAEYCLERIPYRTKTFLDIGCGNGRDTIFFGDKLRGVKVIGLDYSIEAINQINLGMRPFTRAIYHDFTDGIDIIKKLHPDVIYCRFFLHTIDTYLQNLLLKTFLDCAKTIFIECRSVNDKETDYGEQRTTSQVFVSDHTRRLVSPKDLDGWFSCCNCYSVRESREWAKTEKENPLIIRVEGYV